MKKRVSVKGFFYVKKEVEKLEKTTIDERKGRK